MRRRTEAALLAAALLLPPAAGAQQLVDAGVWGSGVSLQPPTWIDGRQVLFLTGFGFRVNEDQRSLAIWETDGKARVYRDDVNHFCYRDGVIVYKALDPADKNLVRGTWYAGPIGSERPVRKDTDKDIARLYDPVNCKIGTTQELAGRASRRSVALLDKHGYLDISTKSVAAMVENSPVRFVRAAGGAAVTLPFGSREFNPPPLYFDFAGSYLIRSVYFDAKKLATVFPWPPDIDRPVWLLKPDGTVARQRMPKGPWTGKDDPFPYLTGAGLVLVRHAGIFEKTDGLYLAEGDAAKHVLPGRVSAVGVSPDGCSIAFTHAPSAEEDAADAKNRRTLKVMRLCTAKPG